MTAQAWTSSSYYEIRVAGVLPPEALLDFDRLTASVEPVETVLHGPLRDQAALRGLLARFEAFGIQLQEVRRLFTVEPVEPVEPREAMRAPGAVMAAAREPGEPREP